jgi:hypothetical protein
MPDSQRVQILKTVNAIIAALGGDADVMRRHRASAPSLSNWRRTRKFPAKEYKLMIDDLAALGFAAPPSRLWGQRDGGQRQRARKKNRR